MHPLSKLCVSDAHLCIREKHDSAGVLLSSPIKCRKSFDTMFHTSNILAVKIYTVPPPSLTLHVILQVTAVVSHGGRAWVQCWAP